MGESLAPGAIPRSDCDYLLDSASAPDRTSAQLVRTGQNREWEITFQTLTPWS